MSVGVVLKKYLMTIKTNEFRRHRRIFSKRLRDGIKSGLELSEREEKIVSTIREIINKLGSFGTIGNQIEISTESVFIHGIRSWVKFDFNGQKTTKELGDIIFLVSVVYRGWKYFEKLTITQVKKLRNGKWNLAPKEQLYLLSHFPSFKGVDRSIIPSREIVLPNYTGCLGTYGLLLPQSDFFILTSAVLLDHMVGPKHYLPWSDLIKFRRYPSSLYNFSRLYLNVLDLLNNAYPDQREMVVTCTSFYTLDIGSFVDRYLRSCIGEPIYWAEEEHAYNKPALLFIHDLMNAIRSKSRSASHFVNSFMRYSYYDYDKYRIYPELVRRENYNPDGDKGYSGGGFDKEEDEGLGIVYTTINLGED